MADVKDIINIIQEESNGITAQLEILRTLEIQKEGIDEEIKKAKNKLKEEAITKFTYAKMQELNQQNLKENTIQRKKIWNEIAENVNNISDKLTSLKELYNVKTDAEGTSQITEETKK